MATQQLDLTVQEFKEFLRPSEKDKILVLIVERRPYAIINRRIGPFDITKYKGSLEVIQTTLNRLQLMTLFNPKRGENLRVILADGFEYEVINGIPKKTGLRSMKRI